VFVVVVNLVIWILMGVLGGRIAAQKGYPPAAGILVGMLIGPFGLLAAALIPKTRRARQPMEGEPDTLAERTYARRTQKCPRCGRLNSLTTRRCARCDHEIAEVQNQ
jgi:hypothetical protein